MITALDIQIHIALFIHIELIELIVLPVKDAITVTGDSVFLERVLTSVFAELVSGEEFDIRLAVEFEVVKRGVIGLLQRGLVLIRVHQQKQLITLQQFLTHF